MTIKNYLEIARTRLKNRNLTLVIVRNDKIIFESKDHGILGLIKAIDELNGELKNSCIADKIVGKAAALLILYAGAIGVYAEIISENGLKTLMEAGIYIEYDKLTPNIMNRTGTDICPFEKVAQKILNLEEAYKKFKSMLR